jgi:hypothetical protein
MEMYQPVKAMERKADESDGDAACEDRLELHPQPAGFHVDVEVVVGAGIVGGPDAEQAFEAVHRQWRHADGHGDQQAAGDLQARHAPQLASDEDEQQGVGDCDGEDAAAAERFPAERHEEAHGADDDQRAEVVGDVDPVELRFGFAARAGLQRGPQLRRLVGGEDAFGGGPVEVVPAQLHAKIIRVTRAIRPSTGGGRW